MEEQDHTTRRRIIVAVAVLVFIYFAREYPQWRAERRLLQDKQAQEVKVETKAEKDVGDATNETSMDSTHDTDKPSLPNPAAQPVTLDLSTDAVSPSPWPDKFSLRWIPYLPFAVVYLVLKAIWTGLRFLVLHSILAAEHLGIFLMVAIEEIVQWTVNHGPDFIQTKLIAPLHTAVVVVYKSPAVAAIASVVESKILPAMARFVGSCQETVVAAATKTLAWTQAAAEPVRIALEWFALECVYNPMNALWIRLAVLGHTFIQTAKIYLSELAKDARDFGLGLVKVGTWIWAHTLQPLGWKLYALGEVVGQALLQFLPWLAQKMYTGAIRPIGLAVMDGFRILRSHPTLLAGIQALSSKVKEKCSAGLQRLESVNWLILLETVLTKVVTNVYHYTTLVLQLVGHGIKVFAVDIVPNAYTDLMMALEVAKPVVAWVVDKFVKVVHPLWQVVSWIAWTVATNARPTVAWIHAKIAVPTIKLWESKIGPGLAYAASAVVVHTKIVTDMILNVAPMIAAVVAPVWGALAKVVEILQTMLAHIGSKILALSGGVGERVQEYIKTLGPQFETFKQQTGRVMDEIVLATSNFMMDWVKNEKRD